MLINYQALREMRKDYDKKKGFAHTKVALAIEVGTLSPEPCERCGSTNVIAHHEDYDLPLMVIWLCNSHHKLRHGEIPRVSEVLMAKYLTRKEHFKFFFS